MIRPKRAAMLKKCTASLTALTLCASMVLPVSAADGATEAKLTDAEMAVIEEQCNEKKVRTILSTDGEHDDMASMVRYLTMANEFNTAAIVLTASGAGHHTGGNITYPNMEAVDNLTDTQKSYIKKTEDGQPVQTVNEDGTVTVTFNQRRWTGFRWIHYYIEKYAEVYDNLKVHDPDYPTPDYLESVVKYGNVKVVGDLEEKTEGSEYIKKLILENPDGEPLYIQHWGGVNTTARALKSIQEEYQGTADWERIVEKINREVTLYMIWENQAPTYSSYIVPNWPGIRVIVNQDSFFNFYSPLRMDRNHVRHSAETKDTWLRKPWGDTIVNIGSPLTSESILNVPYDLSNDAIAKDTENKFYSGPVYDAAHGQSEADNFPFDTWGDNKNSQDTGEFLAEGDTPSYFYLINNGLRSYEDPSWGGWAGRFGTYDETRPNEYKDAIQSGPATSPWGPPPYDGIVVDEVPEKHSTVDPKNWVFSRWVPDFQAYYSAHAQWTIKNQYKQANHHPKAGVMNGLDLNVVPGQKIYLDGVAYDPDGDKLTYKWWRYADADTHEDTGTIKLSNADDLTYKVPENAKTGDTIHLIFEVSDAKSNDMYVSLKNYKRVVLTVTEPIAVSGITLSKKSASMTVGESLRLKAEVTPDDATDKKVVWESTNAAVASVNEAGNVTANKAGDASIIAAASSGVKAVCQITVASKQTEVKPQDKPQQQPKPVLQRVKIKKAKPAKKKVTLTWTKDSKAAGYQIYMSKKKNSGYKKIATIKKAGKVTYTKKKLTSKKNYYFKVRSYKKVGGTYVYGKFSTVKRAKVK